MQIHCKDCGRDFTPSPEQLAFIDSSGEKGMTFIVLKCPRCPGSISYNPRDKRINPPVEPRRMRLRKEIVLTQLPQDYQAFVARFDGSKQYDLDDRSWILYTTPELDELINISGVLVPQSRALAAYTDMLREFHGGNATTDEQGVPFDYNRLEDGFCIGDENGDPLFIDSESKAVYCWHHDGGDVERLAETFTGFLAIARESTD